MNVTPENFESEILKSDVPVLVDFWAPWCAPCRMQAPIVEELGQEIGENAKIYKLNVDELPDIAQEYNVFSIPTIIVFNGGQPVKRAVGLQSKDGLLDMLSL